MIPSDVASRLQLTADAAVGRIPSIQQVADALAQLVPGQRVLAEIQALLPNGAYRAIINQREVTLALPFSAKAGDTLELEVVDSEGKLALAAVSRPPTRQQETSGATTQPAVETTLSRTGAFIASIAGAKEDAKAANPAPLNAQQPVSPAPPQKASELVPLLKQAIGNSGMFYESHQSQWVTAQRPLESLLSEPQGKLSPRLETAASPAGAVIQPVATREAATRAAQVPGAIAADASAPAPAQAQERAAASSNLQPTAATGTPPQLVAQDLVPLVQQQLEALATQTYVWQGQAWPGQPMRWEIDEDSGQRGNSSEEGPPPWQTRLTLTMPSLGEVQASLRLSGGQLALTLTAASPDAENRLSQGHSELQKNFEAAGLAVTNLSIGRHDRSPE